MDTKKEAIKYLNKYFKSQYINENDYEFKSLVRLLNKAQKAVKNCSIPPVSDSALSDAFDCCVLVKQMMGNIISDPDNKSPSDSDVEIFNKAERFVDYYQRHCR